MRRTLRRLLSFFTGARDESELSREIASHLALLEDEYRRRGMSADEARLVARRAMGSVALAKDLHRDARSLPWLEDCYRDARHALRSLRKTPGFTAIAMLTLALGIGANTTIFSVVNGVLLRPLSYEQSDRFVRLMVTAPSGPGRELRRQPVRLSLTEFGELRAGTRTLSHVGTANWTLMNLRGRDPRLQGAVVSADLLSVLGARPLLGRVFTPADESPSAERVIVLGYTVWQRHFGGDSAIVGRRLTFDPVQGPPVPTDYVVIGVLPDNFQFPDRQTQVWLPPRLAREGPGSRAAVVARLADGVSLDAAVAETLPLVRRLLAGQPNTDAATYELVTDHGELVNPVKPALLVLLVGVGLVLLIACVNVANLVLARTASRQREIAIRSALGAGRGRLIRYLLTESVTLGLLGGLAGVALAMVGIPWLKALATTVSRLDLGNQLSFPRLDDVRIDGTVLGFSVAVAIVTGVSFGLLPALRHARSGAADVLRGSGTSGVSVIGWGRRANVQGMLVVAQIGLAMVLLTGGALLLQSFVKLSTVDAGYDPSQVLTFQVAAPTDKYPPARFLPFAADVAQRIRSVPGVVAAAYANQLPLVDIVNVFPLRATPFTPTPEMPRLPPSADAPDVRLVSGDYLNVMRVRVRAGRGLSEADAAGRPRALVINEALARRDFADRNPIGQIVYVGPDRNPWEIVGVVANVRQFGLGLEAQPQFFVNLQQWTLPALVFPVGAYFAVRTTVDPMSVVPQIRALVRQIDQEAVVFYVAPMDEIVSSTLVRPRLYTVLLALFSIVGVGLSVIGIYGVMAYAVAQSTREIGIRIALGAQRVEVLRLVLRQSLVITAVGLFLGLAGAALFTRYLEGLLFGLEPLDPGTFAGVAVLFAIVAALAALIPARRALRIDPLVALRTE